jgi:hypothetical protein
VPPRSQSPVGGRSDDDDPTWPEQIWSQTKGHMRKNKHFRGRTMTEDSKVEAMAHRQLNPYRRRHQKLRRDHRLPLEVHRWWRQSLYLRTRCLPLRKGRPLHERRRKPVRRRLTSLQNQWLPVQEMRAELEACDRVWAAQGKRIRVWPVVTLPKPEMVIFFLRGGFFPPANSAAFNGTARQPSPV